MSLIRISPAEQGQSPPSSQKYEYDYDRFAESLMDPDLKYPMVSFVFKRQLSNDRGLGWASCYVTFTNSI